MNYMGSKARVAKHILPFMLEKRRDRPWVEPFVGGANMIDKVNGIRLGNDINPYLISCLKALRDGWLPPQDVSKELYYAVKEHPENYPPELVCFVAGPCSFGSKWWGGYAHNTVGRNYAQEAHRNVAKQAPKLKGVSFRCGSYLDMWIPRNSLIYCDPPYQSTTKYKDGIDHDVFWEWCRQKAREGHIVFVSEYDAPDDFTCLIEVKQTTTMDKNTKKSRIEKLYTFNTSGV